jgi:hypothetical protein
MKKKSRVIICLHEHEYEHEHDASFYQKNAQFGESFKPSLKTGAGMARQSRSLSGGFKVEK